MCVCVYCINRCGKNNIPDCDLRGGQQCILLLLLLQKFQTEIKINNPFHFSYITTVHEILTKNKNTTI